jgi:FkbM family methyltransferase
MGHPAPLVFNRTDGHLAGATALERLAAYALQAGSKTTAFHHHRGFSLGCRALTPLVGHRDILVQLNDDARFAFPFGDGYWSLLLDCSFSYEDDVNRVLAAMADVDYALIDCGANFGFWSVIASSQAYGRKPVLAVEASAANFEKLRRNASLNGERFEILHRAIGSRKGIVALGGGKHEAVHVAQSAGEATGELVQMITINDLLDRPQFENRSRIVAKLDVEGLEIEAIKGGNNLLSRDTLLIVEDHGADRAHTVSRHLLELGLRVVVLDPKLDEFMPLTDASVLDRIKESRIIGYNVFATNSPFWENRLLQVPRRAPRFS